MTVAAITNRTAPVAGNGVTLAFAFAYPYRASSDLVVISRDTASGIETVKTEGADYTVAGAADAGTGGFSSGTVNFVVAPVTGTTITISREVPATSSYDPTAGAADTAPAREGAIDKLTLLVQLALDRCKRAVKFKRSTTGADDIPMPDPPSGTDTQILGWNAARTALVNFASTTLGVGQAVSAFAATLLDDANVATFFATLGIKTGSATINFASVADNASSNPSLVSVPGAAVGDFVWVSASGDLVTTPQIFLLGKVAIADNVSVYVHNDSGGAFDAASQTVYVVVFPKSIFGL